MIHAAPVPTIPANNPTPNINLPVVHRYRGKVVAIKCGQIFSVGLNASQITEMIGSNTNIAITTAPVDHGLIEVRPIRAAKVAGRIGIG